MHRTVKRKTAYKKILTFKCIIFCFTVKRIWEGNSHETKPQCPKVGFISFKNNNKKNDFWIEI